MRVIRAVVTYLMNLACSQAVSNQPWIDYMPGRKNYMRKSGYASASKRKLLLTSRMNSKMMILEQEG